MYENICFEGGGIKVIAFCGAMEVLENAGLTQNITRFIGSSGGAITAALLSCGFTPNEIKEKVLCDDFSMLKDDSWGIFRDLYRLFKKYGYYKGDAFTEWLGEKLAMKTGNADITFKDIYEKYGNTLVIPGACVNQRRMHYYHYQSNPDMPVRNAVRISISIPFFMQAIFWGDDVLVDSGTFENFPLSFFDTIDEDGKLPNSKNGVVNLNEELSEKTIGLKLLEDNEQSGGGLVFQGNDDIKNLKGYTISLINALFSHTENMYIKPGYWKQTVAINSGQIGTTEFELTDAQKEYLVNEGCKGAEKFLSKHQVSSEISDSL